MENGLDSVEDGFQVALLRKGLPSRIRNSVAKGIMVSSPGSD